MRTAVPTAAAANSFQAQEGATGVIGHNLVDSLIYKQSLMKFLVFINNALQPAAAVGIGTRESRAPAPLFAPRAPSTVLLHRASSSDTLYRPFLLALSLSPLFHRNFATFLVDETPSTCRRAMFCALLSLRLAQRKVNG